MRLFSRIRVLSPNGAVTDVALAAAHASVAAVTPKAASFVPQPDFETQRHQDTKVFACRAVIHHAERSLS